MKFSFRKLMMALVLPMAVAMVSCNNDDPSYSNPSLTVGSRIMTFTKDGGSNTFDINANRSWTITSSETWLVVSPASNDNKTGVETKTSVSVTATANESGPRSANLTISSPALTEPIVIKVSQEGEGATPISEVVAAEAGGVYTVKATVVGVTEKSFVITDNSGSMLVYKAADPGVAIGDIVEVKGTTSSYNNLIQFAKDELVVTPAGHNDNFTQPTPEEMDGEAFTAYASAPSVKYVTLSAKYTLSENNDKTYHNFSVTGSGNRGSFQDVPASMLEGIESGDAVIATGYMIGAYNTNNYMVLVEVKADEGYVEPEIEVSTIDTVTNTGEKGNTYKVEGTVAAVTTKSFVVADATGLLYVYTTPKVGGEFLAIGDVVTVEGTYDEYNSICQLKSAIIKESSAAAVTLPESVEMDVEALDAYSKNPVVKRGTVEATVVVSESGSNTYYNLEFDGTEAFTGSVLYPSEEMIAKLGNGKRVVIDAYLAGFGSTRVQFAAVSVEESTAAYLAAEKSEYEVAAEGGEVEIGINTNVATFTAAVAGIEGAEAVVGEAKVTVTVPANTAAEGRTATVTISAEGVDDVTVTIKQEGASAGEPVQYELVTDASTIANGDEIIFVGVLDGAYQAAAKPYKDSGNTYLTIVEVSTPADGVITLTGEKVDVFTVEASGDFFKFKSTIKDTYLGFKGKDNNITYDDDANVEWSIATGADNAMTIKLNGQDTAGNDRFFQWNSNNTRFSAYKSTSNQADAMIFRKVVAE